MKKTIIFIFALFLIASCSGDDPVHEAETGTLGGNCYPNGTCNAALECSEENICIESAVTDGDTEHSDAGDTASDNDPADSGEDRQDGDTSDTVSDDEPVENPDAECGNGRKEQGEVCEKGETKLCSEIDSSYKSGNVECNDNCNGWLTVNCMTSELEPLATFPARTHELDYLYEGVEAYLEQENILHELWTEALFNASITMNGETYSIPHPQANTHWIAAYYDSSTLSFYQNSYYCDDEMNFQFATPSVMFGAALSSLKAGKELSIGISDGNEVNMLIEDIMNADDCVMLVGYGTLKVDSVNISAGEAGNFKFTTSKIGLYLPGSTPEGDVTSELETAGFKICR
ncbi:membrane lipoprotein lipid attachment site-containing protein [bacterium]|nr:membrane lipoprotein lipid attachment site-containing protein [bacterium]